MSFATVVDSRECGDLHSAKLRRSSVRIEAVGYEAILPSTSTVGHIQEFGESKEILLSVSRVDYRLVWRAMCALILFVPLACAQPGISCATSPSTVDLPSSRKPSAPPQNVIRIAVCRNAKVSFSVDDARAVLTEVAVILNQEYKRLHKTGPAQEVGFALLFQQGDKEIPVLPKVDQAFLQSRRYDVEAVQQSEKTGTYGDDAIGSAIAVRSGQKDTLQIDVVGALERDKCPERGIPVEPASERSPILLGCSAISTSVVAQFPRPPVGIEEYDRWIHLQAVLWAHELGHLVGLHHLNQGFSKLRRWPPLVGKATNYLMMPHYEPEGWQLLKEESEVFLLYPNNQPAVGALKNRLDVLLKEVSSQPVKKPKGPQKSDD